MATNEVFAAVGTEFQRESDDSSGVYAAIAHVQSIEGPGMTRRLITTTALDTAGGYDTFIPSFRDGGEVALGMFFTLDGFTQFKDDFESQTAKNYRIVMSDDGATTLEFAGYVMNLPPSIPYEDAVKCNVTIKVTGQVTLTT